MITVTVKMVLLMVAMVMMVLMVILVVALVVIDSASDDGFVGSNNDDCVWWLPW